MERFNDAEMGWPATVGKHRPEQIANMETWGRVPDPEMTSAAINRIWMVPNNRSTTTYINPLDPGDEATTDWYDSEADEGRLIPAKRGL